KVIIPDTDHLNPRPQDYTWVWKSFARGLNPILLDDLTVDPVQELIRRALGDTLNYANKMDLSAMTPQGNVSSTGYALVNPGSEYLIYQPNSGQFTVHLDAGQYAFEWFHPSDSAVALAGTINGGSQLFTPPFSGDAVLYLKSFATAPSSPS